MGQPELIGQSATAPPENADRMGLIEEKNGAVAVFEFHDIAERSEVAIHAEDRFGDNEDAGLRMFLARPLEVVLEVGGVVVVERTDGGAAQAGAVDQAGVGKFVQEDDVILGRERLQGAGAGGVATAEDEGGGGVFEDGDVFFEFAVGRLGAGDEARGSGSGAEFAGRFEGGGDNLRVGGEAEIVVGGEVVPRFVVEADEPTGGEVRDEEAPAAVLRLEVGEGFLQVVFEHQAARILHRKGRGVH